MSRSLAWASCILLAIPTVGCRAQDERRALEEATNRLSTRLNRLEGYVNSLDASKKQSDRELQDAARKQDEEMRRLRDLVASQDKELARARQELQMQQARAEESHQGLARAQQALDEMKSKSAAQERRMRDEFANAQREAELRSQEAQKRLAEAQREQNTRQQQAEREIGARMKAREAELREQAKAMEAQTLRARDEAEKRLREKDKLIESLQAKSREASVRDTEYQNRAREQQDLVARLRDERLAVEKLAQSVRAELDRRDTAEVERSHKAEQRIHELELRVEELTIMNRRLTQRAAAAAPRNAEAPPPGTVIAAPVPPLPSAAAPAATPATGNPPAPGTIIINNSDQGEVHVHFGNQPLQAPALPPAKTPAPDSTPRRMMLLQEAPEAAEPMRLRAREVQPRSSSGGAAVEVRELPAAPKTTEKPKAEKGKAKTEAAATTERKINDEALSAEEEFRALLDELTGGRGER